MRYILFFMKEGATGSHCLPTVIYPRLGSKNLVPGPFGYSRGQPQPSTAVCALKRAYVCVRCAFRAADGKPATSRTGSTVMRCLGGRNIDPVVPRRTSCRLRCNASRQRIRLQRGRILILTLTHTYTGIYMYNVCVCVFLCVRELYMHSTCPTKRRRTALNAVRGGDFTSYDKQVPFGPWMTDEYSKYFVRNCFFETLYKWYKCFPKYILL